jgi:hypothetical protein
MIRRRTLGSKLSPARRASLLIVVGLVAMGSSLVLTLTLAGPT